MGYTEVRTSVAAYLTGDVVTGLRTVRTGKPTKWPLDDFRWDPTAPETLDLETIASGFVRIERDAERRASTGKRFVDYDVAVVLRFVTARTGPEAGELAQVDVDTIVDGVKARLRVKSGGGGPLGLPDQSVLWQAAERLLEAEHDLPRDDAIDNEAWSVVRFDVSEWLTA